MLGAKIFSKLLRKKGNNSNYIVQYNSNKNFKLQDSINIRIIEIDKQISENSKALIEAKIVQLRSKFTKTNNFIDQIGKNIYKTKLDESIDWHQKQLKELYIRRRELQINLEKIQGIFWLSRIKRFLKIILIGFLILLALFIFLSGFMIIIYLLPLIILISLGYLIANKK